MDLATTLSLTRIAIGVGAWAAPQTVLRAAGMDGDRGTAYLARLFGTRDVALGAATLIAPTSARPALLRLCVAVDAADAGASVLAVRNGGLGAPTGALVTTTAVAAMVAGALAARRREG
jgi:hypothetical protein